ncbi:nucleotidyltransferase domain-containing protein [Methanobrevibacter curvatus]|uniref:protein adenylyltransferase n=1 Tax=Methanobrevibacter curvatus TaxID=49547 RepID=A0A166B043_9EURY|nr:nucleotidyltransferase domain-containing protein [Methanobrevibacter curvatus]KZX12693.1 nucleotidyltransferase domain protein [Methanobrevibacter curvatus]
MEKKNNINRKELNRKELAINFAKSLGYLDIEKIILFGSVACGEDKKDSDIDILIIIHDENKIEKEAYNKVSNFLLETMEYISVKIKNINYYNLHKNKSLFFKNIKNECVLIGGSGTTI